MLQHAKGIFPVRHILSLFLSFLFSPPSVPVPISSTKSLHLPRRGGLLRLGGRDVELLRERQRGVQLQRRRPGGQHWHWGGGGHADPGRRSGPQRHDNALHASQREHDKGADGQCLWKQHSELHTPGSVKNDPVHKALVVFFFFFLYLYFFSTHQP